MDVVITLQTQIDTDVWEILIYTGAVPQGGPTANGSGVVLL